MKTLVFRTLPVTGALLLFATTVQANWIPLTVNQVGPLAATATYNLNWMPDPNCPGCAAYDVVIGDLYVLTAPATAGDFTASTIGCMNNNWAVPPPITPLPVPGAGVGYFFLVRAQPDASTGACFSWNADWLVSFNRQLGDRDAELNASAVACPCP